jgi:beta-glucosidase
MRIRRAAIAVAALALAVVVFVPPTADGARSRKRHAVVYTNAKASVAARVDDLLNRMTLQEKIGQMDQIVLGKLRGPNNPASGDCNGGNTDTLQTNCLNKVLVADKTGSILSGAPTTRPTTQAPAGRTSTTPSRST